MAKTVLKGITWGHSRGVTPLLAAAQRYNELHPDVEIVWLKRTLQEFADFPVEKLTKDYDLLIIDHPWVGCAAATKSVLPLDSWLPAEFIEEQLNNSVGHSHSSYFFNGHQWALAIDAAAPAASFRKDLLEENNYPLPATWQDVLKLAAMGKVAVPAIPVDILMNFYSFCIAHGNKPFQSKHELIDAETGQKAIETMKELYSLTDKKMFSANPIAVAEWMSSSDDYWYCPLAYCYSNYSRAGYARRLLHYTEPVPFNKRKLKTTIGGAGLGVSAFGNHQKIALDFAIMLASGDFQRTFYVQHGGQPGHLSAWQDEDANHLTNGFFRKLLPVMKNGYLRPRYNGYLHFQDHAGVPLRRCLLENGNTDHALEQMNEIYLQSQLPVKTITAI